MARWIKPSAVFQHRQYIYYSHSSLPLIHIPSSSVYHFGDAPLTDSQAAGSAKRPIPVIKDLQWTVHDDEAWAIVSSGTGGGSGKDTVFKVRSTNAGQCFHRVLTRQNGVLCIIDAAGTSATISATSAARWPFPSPFASL